MPIHVRIKLLLKQLLPLSLFTIVSKTWRLMFARFFNRNDVSETYSKLYMTENGAIVTGGPFTGLKYIDESAGSVLLNKLVGYYEDVLHPTIEKIQGESYDTIIDIGCAEGYYLVGLGREMPLAKLIGYDIDERALALSKRLADHNNLSNIIELHTTCTPATLTQDITPNTLLICDAEGFEDEILDPAKCAALLQVQKFVVETHEFAASNIVQILTERFENTHTIEQIEFTMANPEKYPFLNKVTNKKDLFYMLRERGEQEQIWLVMTKN